MRTKELRGLLNTQTDRNEKQRGYVASHYGLYYCGEQTETVTALKVYCGEQTETVTALKVYCGEQRQLLL